MSIHPVSRWSTKPRRAAAPPGGRAWLPALTTDRFKQIIDTLGHAWGDALLREIGPRVATLLRERDLLARVGGDEFAILLPGLGELRAQEVAERIRRCLRQGFNVDGIDLDVDTSIGLARLTAFRRAGVRRRSRARHLRPW